MPLSLSLYIYIYIRCPRKNVYTLLFHINTIFIQIYFSFIIQVKESRYRIFRGNAGVRTDDQFSIRVLLITRTIKIANISELSQVFKLMTILSKELLIIQTDGIANFSNRLRWYLDPFFFIFCSQLIDCSTFPAIKLNGPIKCNNYDSWTPRNLHITVEHHANLQEFTV